MESNEKRIRLTHGTAVVSKDVSQETIDALNNMVALAYKQVLKEGGKKKKNTT
jgi:hypothetical protein